MTDRRSLDCMVLGRTVRILIAICAAALGGCWSPQPAAPPTPAKTSVPSPDFDAAIDELLDLMRQRLTLMHDVARWKWNERKPIADPGRERQLLADLERRGLAYGLSRKHSRAFIAAQMEAGKLLQEADFAGWTADSQGKFSDVRDLNSELRPLIDELSERLLAQLAKLATFGRLQVKLDVKQRADDVLRGDGIDDVVRRAAIRPLLDDSLE
jgi:chorismate mutase